MADEREGPLARPGESRPWRGDDHALRVSAGREVGLARREVALDSFQEGFARGVTMVDDVDGALVLRGRTVLDVEQLRGLLEEPLRRQGLGTGGVVVAVTDGDFEVRVDRGALMRAGAIRPVGGAAGVSVGVAVGVALSGVSLGLSGLASGPLLAMILVGLAVTAGGLHLSWSRRLVARRLVAMMGDVADREGLVLPPAQREPSA